MKEEKMYKLYEIEKDFYTEENYNSKSIIRVGNILIYSPLKFNKFQKWLWKRTFNIKIEDCIDVE